MGKWVYGFMCLWGIFCLLCFNCVKQKEKNEYIYPPYSDKLDTLLLSWSYPDTCAGDDVYEFQIWMAKRSLADSVVIDSVLFTDVMYVQHSVTCLGVEIKIDSLEQYGGFEYIFSMRTIDAADNFSVWTDTVSIVEKMKCDMNDDGVIDGLDQMIFDDMYRFLYGLRFEPVELKKEQPDQILRFRAEVSDST